MTEYKIIELNEKDIKQILSEKYGTEVSDVYIEVSNGDPQYPKTSVYAEIRLRCN